MLISKIFLPTLFVMTLFATSNLAANTGYPQIDFKTDLRGDASESSEDSLILLRKKAEGGNPDAQATLGDMYLKGWGVPKDINKSAIWYRKAAEQGEARAQSNLGVMYERGEGVPQNYSEAAKWYRRAAEQGNAVAQFTLVVGPH